MSLTWGQLAKSAVDEEKIEEAIERLIQEHDDDPEAHLSAGGSLNSHKASEIIDHLVKSIIADKIKDGEVFREKLGFNMAYIRPTFEGMDLWTKTGAGNYSAFVNSITLYTTSTINSICELFCDRGPFPIQWANKKASFHAIFRMISVADCQMYLGVGGAGSVEIRDFIGFKTNGSTLYGVWHEEAVEKSISLMTISAGVYYSVRWELTPGEKIDFFVNNVLIDTAESNLPDYYNSNAVFYAYIKTLAASTKSLGVTNLEFVNER